MLLSKASPYGRGGRRSLAERAFAYSPSHPLSRELSHGESLIKQQPIGAFCERPRANSVRHYRIHAESLFDFWVTPPPVSRF